MSECIITALLVPLLLETFLKETNASNVPWYIKLIHLDILLFFAIFAFYKEAKPSW